MTANLERWLASVSPPHLQADGGCFAFRAAHIVDITYTIAVERRMTREVQNYLERARQKGTQAWPVSR